MSTQTGRSAPPGPMRRHLPLPFGRRYGVFSGTNDRTEADTAFALSRDRASRFDDEALIREYEAQFAAVCGTTHAHSFGAGRMALYAILEALEIGEGDEVILPAFTCVVVSNALLYRKARPVYVDIDPITFNVDPARIEAAITPRTRALYAQHTFGVPCEVDQLREIANKHGLRVIEDCAHALGATWRGGRVGSLSDAAFFSTDHTKMINTMVGGMVTTSDSDVAAQVAAVQERAPFLSPPAVRAQLRSFSLGFALSTPETFRVGRYLVAAHNRALGSLFDDEMLTTKPTRYPYPCRLSSAHAQIGLSQLDALTSNLSHRRAIASWLESRLHWYGTTIGRTEPSWLRYSFLVRDQEEFARRLRRRFDLGIWFRSVVHGRSRNLEAVGYSPGSCPAAERVTRHIVNLPTHPRVPLEVIQEAWREHGDWIGQQVIR